MQRISLTSFVVLFSSLVSASALAQSAPAEPTPAPPPPAPAPVAAPTSDAPSASGTTSTGVAAGGSAEASSAPPSAVEPLQPPPPSDSYPRIGGHLGLAMPIVTLAKNSTAIGADFVTVGITPGVTVHLSDEWAIDFEFIAFNDFKTISGNVPAATTFVVDPGIVRKFKPLSVGLRVATQVGAPTNIGLVPIVVVPVTKIGKRLSYFLEADLPLFLRDEGSSMQPSATLLLQTGFGF